VEDIRMVSLVKKAEVQEVKIIAVTRDKGLKYLFSIERIEHFIKTQTGWDFKFKIVPVNTVTHGDIEID